MTASANRCPITYEKIESGERYSEAGLKKLAPKLKSLADLSLTAQELRIEARKRADKISIQGVQPKLSAKLNVPQACFEIIDVGGRYILKPPHDLYPEISENEDLSMRLATAVGIEVPLHGLLFNIDGTRTYFIKRFDRVGHNKKLAVEDFAQLSHHTRSTKYDFTMEKLIPIIDTYCTFPVVEKRRLLLRTLFNFLIGNEDMHLKNFSLISRDNKIELAPAYDFLNTTIVLGDVREELALPLNGKKRNLKRRDFVDYYASKRLGLSEIIAEEIMGTLSSQLPHWEEQIQISFLSEEMKAKYWQLIKQRSQVLSLS